MVLNRQRPQLPLGTASQVVVIELIALCFIVLPCFLIEPTVAKSATFGGLLFIVPNAYFTFYAFRFRGAAWTYRITRSFYRGQTGKLALTAVGFALVFRFVDPLHNVGFFSVFALMMAVHIGVAASISSRSA